MIEPFCMSPQEALAAMNRKRFLSKVAKGEANQCWPWTAVVDKYGYGKFWFQGSMNLAHIVAHVLFIGPIPVGHEVHHICENPACVNWLRHLKAVTAMRKYLMLATARDSNSQS